MALDAREFAPDEPVAPGALVEVRDEGETLWYFLGPSAGGTAVKEEGRETLVITAASPLGRLLVGKRAGDTLPGGMRVVSVS